jgi:hypothetical protein
MSRRFFVFAAVILIAFGVVIGPAFASIDPDSFTLVLTFLDASATSCGTTGNIAFSTPVTFGGGISHTQVAKVTDGNGQVLFEQSGPTFPDYTYTSFGSFTLTAVPTSNPITAVVVFDGVTYTGTADILCLPSSVFQGAPIPTGFVLRTITCDTPVYDTAGGKPVGDNKVTNGQTWYVNPTPVSANGQSWTEIFVAGYINGFVLTSCVQ